MVLLVTVLVTTITNLYDLLYSYSHTFIDKCCLKWQSGRAEYLYFIFICVLVISHISFVTVWWLTELRFDAGCYRHSYSGCHVSRVGLYSPLVKLQSKQLLLMNMMSLTPLLVLSWMPDSKSGSILASFLVYLYHMFTVVPTFVWSE